MSAFHLTASEVGVGAAVVVLTGAVLTFVATIYQTRASLKTQREIARDGLDANRLLASDERLWKLRAEIYTSAIELIHRNHPMSRGSKDVINILPDDLAAAARYFDVLRESTPGMAALAERETFEAWEAMISEAHKLSWTSLAYRVMVTEPVHEEDGTRRQFSFADPGDQVRLKQMSDGYRNGHKNLVELTETFLACVRKSLQAQPSLEAAKIRGVALTYGTTAPRST